MSTHLQHALQEQISVLSEDEMRLVLSFVSNLRKKEERFSGETHFSHLRGFERRIAA